MKEVVIILYYKTKEISEEYLRSLVNELYDLQKKIIITSHSFVPDDILKKCEGFIYDKDNHQEDLTYKRNIIYWDTTEYFTIYSPFFYYGTLEKSYCYSAVKMWMSGLNFAWRLGFDYAHILEYDAIIKTEEISDNSKIIESGDFNSVVYKSENSEMSGPYTCIKLDNFIKRWNLDEIRHHYSNFENRCEVGSYELIKKWIGESRIKHKSSDLSTTQKVTSISKNPNIALYENGEIIEVFVHNFSDSTINNLCMYHSGGRIVIDELYSGVWICHYVAKKSDYFFFHIYINDVLQKKWDIFSQEEYNRIVGMNGISYHNQ